MGAGSTLYSSTSLIRRLYREYKLQIGFAFLLVVFENIAYIAEPFVFGKAIDGLREAHRVEEEVDSSISTLQLKQVADSVRQHVLDSLRIIDTIRQRDSASGAVSEAKPTTAFQYASYRTNRSYWTYSSSSLLADKKERGDTADIIQFPPEGSPERATIDSMKRLLARRDSIRSRRRHSLLKMPRDSARDSIP